MTCICGHHEKAHLSDIGLCAAPEGCNCNRFRKPAPNEEPFVDAAKATQDAEWLAGSSADTAERNLARAYLALKDEVAGFEAMWEARERAHDAEIARIESDLSRSRDAHNAAIRERDTYRAWWLKVQDIAHAEREGRIKAEQGERNG